MKAKSTGKCPNCNGKGVYYGRGEWVNNVFKGFTGMCFNCVGKGWTTAEDDKRNKCYLKHNAYRILMG